MFIENKHGFIILVKKLKIYSKLDKHENDNLKPHLIDFNGKKYYY